MIPSKEPGFFALHSVHQNALMEPSYALIQWFLLFTFLLGGSMFQTLIHTFFRCARGENQSVLEWSGDIDSESRRFQFARGTYPRLSQYIDQ